MRLFAVKILLYELVLAWERNRVNWLFAEFPFLRRPRLFGAAYNPFVFEAAAGICAFSACNGESCRFHHFAEEILRFVVQDAVDKHPVFFDHSLRVVAVSGPRFWPRMRMRLPSRFVSRTPFDPMKRSQTMSADLFSRRL